MTQIELDKIIDRDNYHIDRKKPTEFETRLFLKEVNYTCPLCSKNLQSRSQKKQNKLFQIAHIYPNKPTIAQYELLHDQERLGNSSEDFENKIALCIECHQTQDYHTTVEEYNNLLNIKKQFLTIDALNDSIKTIGLEKEIKTVIECLVNLRDEDTADLNYNPIQVAKKFDKSELLLKTKISSYVFQYFTYIRECFKELDGKNHFIYRILAEEIHSCFEKMNSYTNDKTTIFNSMVAWIKLKTNSDNQEACEAIVSFFVQNCEVFYEITK